jgi:hypothetical protein
MRVIAALKCRATFSYYEHIPKLQFFYLYLNLIFLSLLPKH